MKNNLKIAIIHDYLREYGGAERVLEALHEMYPQAPVYVAFVDQKAMGIHWQKFADWDVRETWLARVPLIKSLYSPLRVLAARAFQSLDLSEYDLIISSSNAYQAKAVAPNGTHVCYCHTPPRSLYGYSTMTNWKKNPLIRVAGNLINHYMRVVDYQAAQTVDHFIANSQETQRRINKFYRRKSVVINPPVDVPEKLSASSAASRGTSDRQPNDDYYLYVNRLALSKHPELAVQACIEMDIKLKVVGTGPMMSQLKSLAEEKFKNGNIEFMGAVTDEELDDLYAGAKALIYPVEDEDFGIVPVEAMGHGVPVIAHKSGGPRETIVDGKTGVFFDDLSLAGLKKAIEDFQKQKFDKKKIHNHAQKFSKERFVREMKEFISSLLR